MSRYLFVLASVFVAALVLAVIARLRNRPRVGELLLPSETHKQHTLCAGDFARIAIDARSVPEDLRDLIAMAEKWGIGDDVARVDFEQKSSEAERSEFRDALRGRTARVTAWLDSFRPEPPSEAGAIFMTMLEALDESGLWPDGPTRGARV